MAEKNLLTVKAFAKLTGIKESTLRYYDKLGLFKPSIRKENGYRYYSPAQIIAVNAVRFLSDLGVPTKRIGELTQNRTPDIILDVVTEKELEVAEELNRIQSSYNVLRTLRKLMQRGISSEPNSVSIQFMEEQAYKIGPETHFKKSDSFIPTFMEFCKQAEERRIDLRLPIGGMFTSFESYMEHPNQPEYFVSLDPTGPDKKPHGRYLTANSLGYYGSNGINAEHMKQYMDENGLEATGPVYEIYLLDEISVADPNNYLSQSAVLLK